MTAHDTPMTPDPKAAPPVDPRPDYAELCIIAGRVLAGITVDQARLPTPCPDYDVDQLTAHLVAVQQRVAAVARGEDPFSVPQEADRPADGSWPEAWARATSEVERIWADDMVLARDLTLPWTTMPGAVALTIYCAEVAVHTWDLARSTGQEVTIDDRLLEGPYQAMVFGLPADDRGPDAPFDPVVPTADHAPLLDRLAAWVGRDPARWPAKID